MRNKDKNRSSKKKEKPIKKKNYKAAIITLAVLLVIVFAGLITVAAIMLNMHSDSLYPSGVLVSDGEISAFSRQMEADRYKPLNEIAVSIANDGNGPLLTPVGRSREFDYAGDVLAKLKVSTGSGRIIVRQGSSNIQDDIISSTSYYYDFLGSLKPKYKEKVSEGGQLSNYQASYSSGYVTTGNFIKKNGFYVAAFETSASPNGRYLFIVYATESQKELQNMIGLLKDFTTLALEGDASLEDPTDEEKTDTEATENSAEMSEDEWNAYFETNKVDPSRQVSLGEEQRQKEAGDSIENNTEDSSAGTDVENVNETSDTVDGSSDMQDSTSETNTQDSEESAAGGQSIDLQLGEE